MRICYSYTGHWARECQEKVPFFMYGFRELLEKTELPKRLFGAIKEIGGTFRCVCPYLSTRLLRPNDPKSGTFLHEKQEKKRHFSVVFALVFKGYLTHETGNSLTTNVLPKRLYFRVFGAKINLLPFFTILQSHFVGIIQKESTSCQRTGRTC